ncbi:MAG: arsenosugar biosynthesis radical SAM (seleno)protein ArsS [Gammaproteobacteria bacterium]
MHATLPRLQSSDFPVLKRGQLTTMQVNLGYRCNQSCLHCHVNAGPSRKEQMSRTVLDSVFRFIDSSGIETLDVTGGAPEMHPDFCYLVERMSKRGVQVIDRCNLTILNEPGYEAMAEFLAKHRVIVVASLPCYLEENVESQRGVGVYKSSMKALQTLNRLGYGKPDSELVLNLMYNPIGPSLPPEQTGLEADYKRELLERSGVVFNQLFVLVNMPIQRFGSTLISHGQFDEYMSLLKGAHQDSNLDSVMCRSLISVDWQGRVYDCDFNQMLDMPLTGKTLHLDDLIGMDLQNKPIQVADHCYGCTAGQGSSCDGALE